MLKSLLVIAVLVPAGQACKGKRPKVEINEAATKTINLGTFVPDPGNPAWENGSLIATPEGKEQFTTTFSYDPSRDVTLEAESHKYQFSLRFEDKSRKAIYESCPEEKAKIHRVDAANAPTIKICKYGSSEPVGQTAPATASSPPSESGSGDGSGGGIQIPGGGTGAGNSAGDGFSFTSLNGLWLNCSLNRGRIGSEYKSIGELLRYNQVTRTFSVVVHKFREANCVKSSGQEAEVLVPTVEGALEVEQLAGGYLNVTRTAGSDQTSLIVRVVDSEMLVLKTCTDQFDTVGGSCSDEAKVYRRSM